MIGNVVSERSGYCAPTASLKTFARLVAIVRSIGPTSDSLSTVPLKAIPAPEVAVAVRTMP